MVANNQGSLLEIGKRRGTDKFEHGYLDVYEHYFEHFRKKPVNILEIGVRYGNSIWTWHDYFKNGNVFGMDILNNAGYYKELYETHQCPDGKRRAMWHHESTGELVKFSHLPKNQQEELNKENIELIKKKLPNDRFKLFIGDQSNLSDLQEVVDGCKEGYDVIIDDGSHAAAHQQISLDFLFKHLKPGGVYVIEDLMMGTQRDDDPAVEPTNTVLKSFQNTGKLSSHYIKDGPYLEENIEEIDWPLQGRLNNKICFITKKGLPGH